MAAAWAVSMCYVKFPEKTESYLGAAGWMILTYNKSLQKIHRIPQRGQRDEKRIRAMKRL